MKKILLGAIVGSVMGTSAIASDWTGWTTPNGLNFRDGHPGSWGYETIIATLPYCAKVTVKKCSTYNGAKWCNVNWKNRNGWVAGKYLSRTKSHCAHSNNKPKSKKKSSY
jgi:uncharacterized protein YraI